MSLNFDCTFKMSNGLQVTFEEHDSSKEVGFGEMQTVKGLDGATFTPSISEDGILSWTNNGNLKNPEPFNLGASGGGVGEDVAGTIQTPFDPNEAGGFEYIYEEPQEALDGAEIFNSYDGDRDGMGVVNYDRNIAIGFMSQASGFRTQAIGNYSKASGWWTRADGQCAVAEGLLSIASGHFSHAEGTRTRATINNAHSEGDMTVASGRQSHAEGQETVASGFCSHSEGSLTQATGYYSHAEGLGTIAAGKNQTVMGKYNVKDTTSLLIVGRGAKDSDRKNAFFIDANGNGWFFGDVYVGSTGGKSKDSGSKKLATEEFVKQLMQSVAKTAKIGTVTLLAEAWTGSGNLYSQVVSIEGVTENSQVDLTPSVQQLVAFYEKDITFVTENEGGVVTVYVIGQKPANDYTIQVTITEVDV